MPLFFSSSEFGLLQDIGLSASTKARCAFLSDFEEAVLKQLHKSPGDPFSGHKVAPPPRRAEHIYLFVYLSV